MMDKKEFIKNFREFVKEVRKLNTKFGVGKKFNFKVMAYIHISEIEDLKDGILFTDVYENPFRVDLRRLEFPYPDVIQTLRRKKRKLSEPEVESWISWRKFSIKNWISRMFKKVGGNHG